jgi:F-type H+-transporting ATPase subunit alpha
VLLALEAGLFDRVPLDKMPDAEQALRSATAKIPADIAGRFATDQLSDADRRATLEVATNALAPLLPKADPNSTKPVR